MRFLLLIMLIITFFQSFAQKHDYIWHLGSGAWTHDPNYPLRGKTIIDFNGSLSENLIYSDPSSHIKYHLTSNSMSDEEGNYLFTYNGYHIENADREIMQNSDNLSESGDPDVGDPMIQGGLVLKVPKLENAYALFHISSDFFDLENEESILGGKYLYYSLIDMNDNNGLGAITIKKQILISDTLDFGKLTACLHANGEDWWILVPGSNNDKYFRILLTKEGPEVFPPLLTGMKHFYGSGNATFSQNGEYYAHFSSISEEIGSYFFLYNFDRCSGLLSNPLIHHFEAGFLELGSVVFSPNSKILYLMAYHSIFQFKLDTEDVIGSKYLVAERNDYLDTIEDVGWIYRNNFVMSQLAPDGKIYICPYPNIRIMSTIEYPDVWGEGCMVNQPSIIAPTVKVSIPLFPNYRLGPLEGSPCDTLGIVKLPLSRWRADQSDEDYLEFRMVDVSDYEPTEWYWDFGDGNTSEERNPTHNFSTQGVYEICLTVSNGHGSDKSCETFQIGSTGVSTEDLDVAVSIYPNPVQVDLYIDLGAYYPAEARVILYNSQGKRVKEQRLFHGSNYIFVGNLPSGMYMYRIEDLGVEIKVGKLVKE